jgi:hypothetical protein
MTTRLSTTTLFLIALAFLAFAIQPARTAQRYITAAMTETEIMISVSDGNDEMPTNDCGHNITIRIVKFLANDKTDPCNIGTLSRAEFIRRVQEHYARNGLKLDFPNGVTTSAIRYLARTPEFIAASRAVIDEFANAHGFRNLPIYLDNFPYDAFMR